MSEETKKALEAFALQIIDAAKAGGQWTAEQTPLLVQEWLRWRVAEHTIYLVAWWLFVTLLGIIACKGYQMDKEDPYNGEGSFVFYAFGISASILFIITTSYNAFQIVKVVVAPRVVVFEQFIQLVR